jgi:hypothetical protein
LSKPENWLHAAGKAHVPEQAERLTDRAGAVALHPPGRAWTSTATTASEHCGDLFVTRDLASLDFHQAFFDVGEFILGELVDFGIHLFHRLIRRDND